MKKDITARRDLELLMRAFYDKALSDPKIGLFFTEIANIDLDTHLPHIIDFWELQVFRKGGYKKNVLQIHLDLNTKKKIEPHHFETWLSLFNTTIDDHFSGENAHLLKTRALSIVTVMKLKMD